MQHTTPNNPWKGLQSYSEGDPIYGRNHDIVQLSRKIIDNPQTVIYGESGNGKTSILRAGIFPILRQRNFFPVLIRLDHKDLTLSYNAQIFEAVEGALKALRFNHLIDPDQTISGTIREVRAPFDSDKEETLWEYFHRREFFYEHPITHEQQAITPVLVFDQFEEIFSLQTQEHTTTSEKSRVEFFTQLTNLLNEIRPDELILQDAEFAPSSIDSESDLSSLIRLNTTIEEPYLSQANCHLVFSLRNDYLAHLERYTENIPSLKHNRYCLLPLSEDQAAEIIMRPIPDYIPVQVAKVIIGKIADVDPDSFEIDDNPELEVSAPILSLYLYELFEKNPDPSRAITVEMIEELGDNLIDNFYLRTVNDATKISAESVAVLEDLLITKDRKRDHSFHSRLKDRGVSEEELNYLIDKRILNEFPTRNGMRIEFSHDKLCRIICKNRQERQERIAKIEAKKRVATRLMKRNYKILKGCLFASFIAFVIYLIGWQVPINDRYANFTKQYGWPKGLNALTKEQAKHLPCHFVLKKKGYFTPHYSIVECRNSYDSLCCDHSVSTYIFSDTSKVVNQYIKELFAQVCQWEFVAEQTSNRVIQERFYDKEHHLALTFNRDLPLQPRKSATNARQTQKEQEKIKRLNNNTFIGKYTDPQGFPLLITISERINKESLYAPILRITYDKNGYEAKVEFFNLDGIRTMNNDGAYQAYYEYDQKGRLLSQSSLNRYGKRMIDQAGNCGIQYHYDEQHPFDPYLLISVDEFGRECTTVDGWSRLRMRYDEWGRAIEASAWRMEGDQEVAATKEEWGCHAMHFGYDDRGNKTNLSGLDTERDILWYQTAQYDALGRRIHEDTNGIITEIAYAGNGEVRQLKNYALTESDTTWLYQFERRDTLLIQYNYTDSLPNQNITHYDRQGRIVEDLYYELDGITPLFMPYPVKYHKAYWRYDDEYFYKSWLETTQTIQEYYTCDSQEPYRIDTSYKIEDLNRTLAKRHENGDLTSIDVQYDNYENLIMQYVNLGEGDYKLFFERSIKELNEKTNGIEIGYLTRYGFPTDRDTFTYGGHSVNVDITEFVDSLYQMPEIYRQERNRSIVFIEVTDGDSEPWYGVVMHTARGRIEFGAADYTEENNGHDPNLEFVTLLNLTTMQIQRINTSEYKFVDLFNYLVGEQEYAIYEQHYNEYKENPLEPMDNSDQNMCLGWDIMEAWGWL